MPLLVSSALRPPPAASLPSSSSQARSGWFAGQHLPQHAKLERRRWAARHRRVAAASAATTEDSGSSSGSSRDAGLAELKTQLADAVAAEDYAAAASLRDRIAAMPDPVAEAEESLKRAVAEERWEVRGQQSGVAMAIPCLGP